MTDIFKAIKYANIEEAKAALREHGLEILGTKNADGLTPLAYLRERVQSAHEMVADAKEDTGLEPEVLANLVARAKRFDDLKSFIDIVALNATAKYSLTTFSASSARLETLEREHARAIQAAQSETMGSLSSVFNFMRR